jgi:hypothetical protein
VRP